MARWAQARVTYNLLNGGGLEGARCSQITDRKRAGRRLEGFTETAQRLARPLTRRYPEHS